MQVLPDGKPEEDRERAHFLEVLLFSEEQEGEGSPTEFLFANLYEISHHKFPGYFLWIEDTTEKVRQVKYKQISVLLSLNESETLRRKPSLRIMAI